MVKYANKSISWSEHDLETSLYYKDDECSEDYEVRSPALWFRQKRELLDRGEQGNHSSVTWNYDK